MDKKDIKICVYAICKNEAKFVEKWLDNMSEADYICVLDTGSTDGTYDLLKKDSRVTVVKKESINPWRFDVARNESMKLIPEDADVLVCTDFDEVFNKGWADAVREAWVSKEGVNRLTYSYAWSHDGAGIPTDIFTYDKMHTRDYHWVYPVHEVLMPIDDNFEEHEVDLSDKILLEHFRDTSKPRAYYLDLLKLSCKENPDDCHVRMLLAREYLLDKDYDNALKEYLTTVDMPEIDNENRHLVLIETLGRISSLYLLKGEFNNAMWYALEMMQNDKTYREPYFLMAEIYNVLGYYEMAVATTEVGLKVAERHYTWVERANTWTYWADDLLAFAYFKLGETDKAIEHMKVCLKHMPNESRFLKNYICMLESKYNIEGVSNE
jgi:glycosyltransferase involved in cell wall biosynthesis